MSSTNNIGFSFPSNQHNESSLPSRYWIKDRVSNNWFSLERNDERATHDMFLRGILGSCEPTEKDIEYRNNRRPLVDIMRGEDDE